MYNDKIVSENKKRENIEIKVIFTQIFIGSSKIWFRLFIQFIGRNYAAKLATLSRNELVYRLLCPTLGLLVGRHSTSIVHFPLKA